MFSLLMSGGGWEPNRQLFGRGRTFEYTQPDLVARFMKSGVMDTLAVAQLPALFAAETRYDNSEALARVGTLTRIRSTVPGSNYQLEYAYEPDITPIPNAKLAELRHELGIEEFEFSRTHWAIKDADLFKVLLRANLGQRLMPKVFNLTDHPIDESLVAVMMPFDARFDPVYVALQGAATALGMTCRRGDDIWDHDNIIQDVVSLIGKAKVVICDLTGRNANVFYETGIAHTLGRDVILITQSAADVPFDVSAIRHVRYLPNGEGYRALASQVAARLESLRSR
ncbi:MAG: hypothetical protein ABIU96_07100 [Rhodanobacter sp.]